MVISALRNIKKGEQITISYLGGFAPYEQRQLALTSQFKFECRCQAGSMLLSERHDSDVNLVKIQMLIFVLANGTASIAIPI
jgi:hypothetical protein